MKASLTRSSLEFPVEWERDRSSEVTDDFAKLRERGEEHERKEDDPKSGELLISQRGGARAGRGQGPGGRSPAIGSL